MLAVSLCIYKCLINFFFFQAEDGIRDYKVTGVQTCALPIYLSRPTQSSHHPPATPNPSPINRSEEHTSELQSPCNLVCRLLLEKKHKSYGVEIIAFVRKENCPGVECGELIVRDPSVFCFFFEGNGPPRYPLSSPTRRSSD